MAQDREAFAIFYTESDLRFYADLISPVKTPDFDESIYRSMLDTIAAETTKVEENGRTSFDNWFYDNRPNEYDDLASIVHGVIDDYFKEALKGEGFVVETAY